MEVPMPLTKEEVELLSEETRGIYKGITGIDFTVHYSQYLNTFYDGVRVVLNELIEKLGDLAKYKEPAFAENKTRAFGAFFINSIITKRNELVRYKKDTRTELHRLSEGLEKVILEPREIEVGGYKVSFDNKVLKDKANEIIELIKSDIPLVPKYVNAYWQARKKYSDLKEEYESKSDFAKVVARFNGEKRKLSKAEAKVKYYDSITDPELDEAKKIVHNGKVVDEFRFKGEDTPTGFREERVGKHL